MRNDRWEIEASRAKTARIVGRASRVMATLASLQASNLSAEQTAGLRSCCRNCRAGFDSSHKNVRHFRHLRFVFTWVRTAFKEDSSYALWQTSIRPYGEPIARWVSGRARILRFRYSRIQMLAGCKKRWGLNWQYFWALFFSLRECKRLETE
jgi:hypothetical protein